MNELLLTLLNFLQQYGYPALWVSVFIASFGAPLPIALVLLAAGAFAVLGDFNIAVLALLSITASVAGDNLGYFVGRRWGSKALLWLAQSKTGQRLLSPARLERSRQYFARRGGWAIFLSRFLVSALGGVINLLAGAELYPYRKFLVLDISGEALGVVIPLTLGFIFGASWDAVGDVLGSLSLLILALCIVFISGVWLVRLPRHIYARRAKGNALQAGGQKISVSGALPLDPPVNPQSSGKLPPL